MDPHKHFAMLARYNVWATNKLSVHVDAMSEDDYRRECGLYFKSVHGALNHLLVAEHLLWFRRFAEGVDDRLDYTSTRGVSRSLPFAAALAHVFNHGTHHRGQITSDHRDGLRLP